MTRSEAVQQYLYAIGEAQTMQSWQDAQPGIERLLPDGPRDFRREATGEYLENLATAERDTPFDPVLGR